MPVSKYGSMVVTHIIETKEENENTVPLHDYRATKPIGVTEKDKQTIFLQKLIKTKIHGTEISIAAPNEIALSLNVSSKNYQSAIQLRKNIKLNAKISNGTLYKKDITAAYDYLEKIQTSIIFAYKAVESFCNATIPDSYVYKVKNQRDILEHYKKTEIERWISTSDKVSKILPELLEVEPPTQNTFWSKFKQLEKLRNEIIHSKSSTNAKILSELFSQKVDDYIKSCTLLLEYFMKKDPSNPAFPLGFGESEIKVTKVKNVGDFFKKVD